MTNCKEERAGKGHKNGRENCLKCNPKTLKDILIELENEIGYSNTNGNHFDAHKIAMDKIKNWIDDLADKYPCIETQQALHDVKQSLNL